MLTQEILGRDAYLLTIELKLFWTIAALYVTAVPLFLLFTFTRLKSIGNLARGILTGAATLHIILVIFRTFEGGRAPFQTLYESLSWFACSAAVTFLIVSRKWKDFRLPGAFVATLCAGACFYALFGRDPAVEPLSPPLQSYWFESHVFLAFTSYAVFIVSCSIEASCLILRPFLKRGMIIADGFTEESIRRYRRTSFNLVTFGFPLLTFCVFSGAAWANEAWGRYWSWDPKETWSLITWSVFTIYLHAYGIRKWRGNVASYINILGFFCMMMTFLGVNWLAKILGIPSLHLYSV
ncbi:MAG: cytochrome c biogenesis protein CcsA [Deltaproteobacteria bacterium]|nr:cytochrome c biogenesis protein CcsA [Deltaproteobacteria bacterium]